MDWEIFLQGLYAVLALSAITWFISLLKKDVSIVDITWSLMLVLASAVYIFSAGGQEREWLIYTLVVIWGLRLAFYITVRSWGEAEDSRYQDIRKKYSPNFPFKSLFIIFVFQAVLAWVLSLPLFVIFTNPSSWVLLDYLAFSLVMFGIIYESIADYQLYRFKRLSNNKGKVLDAGLWAHSRHPNYFAESVVWWGIFLFALAHGYWWTIISPLLITYLLLKFSGVTLMEETITERRPEYRQYIETTSAFLPWPRKQTNPANDPVDEVR